MTSNITNKNQICRKFRTPISTSNLEEQTCSFSPTTSHKHLIAIKTTKLNLAAKATAGSHLPLEGMDHIHGRHRLPPHVFRVGHRIADHLHLANAPRLLINQPGGHLHTTAAWWSLGCCPAAPSDASSLPPCPAPSLPCLFPTSSKLSFLRLLLRPIDSVVRVGRKKAGAFVGERRKKFWREIFVARHWIELEPLDWTSSTVVSVYPCFHDCR